QPRQEPGRYLIGAPEQAQVSVLFVAVGVSVTVTAAPTELAAVEPVTVTIPPVETVAPVTLPAEATEQSAATVVGMLPPADCAASVMQVRAPLAVSISSETFARTV